MEIDRDVNGADFVRHEPCDKCGSSDANALYTDGSMWCFSCSTYTSGDQEEGDDTNYQSVKVKDEGVDLLSGEFKELRARQIDEATCRKFDYRVGIHNGQSVQIATYKDRQGKPVAQKIRTKDKQFSVVGNAKEMGLFGMHLWSAGKKIVVCEGEIDTMTVSMIQGNKFATVGLAPWSAVSQKTFAETSRLPQQLRRDYLDVRSGYGRYRKCKSMCRSLATRQNQDCRVAT